MDALRYQYDGLSALRLALNSRARARGSHASLRRVQSRRLAQLVSHARRSSPFYRELYEGLPDLHDVEQLSTLPKVDKAQVLERFDEVVTDRSLSAQAVLSFADDPSNLGTRFRGKYFVARSSGTSGHRGHFVHDLFSYFLCFSLTAAHTESRAVRRRVLASRTGPRRLRIASLLPPVANLGVASVVASAPRFVRGLVQFQLLDLFEPLERTVESLNDFQPDVVGTFPPLLDALVEEARCGRLCVSPVNITASGEVLDGDVRERVEKTFGCPVYDRFGCAEVGWLGMECEEREGMHVFSDWFLVEPVDGSGAPVSPGRESESLLVTNLANYVQPLIRYELSDRIVLDPDPCPCGSTFPRMRVRGRGTSRFELRRNDGGIVRVAPVELETVAEMIPGLERFQIVQESSREFVIRVSPREGMEPSALREAVRRRFAEYLRQRELDRMIRFEVRVGGAFERGPGGKLRKVLSRRRVSEIS